MSDTQHDTRQAVHFEQAEALGHEDLRRHFLIETLFAPGTLRATYSHYDRMVLLGISPTDTPLRFGDDLAGLVGSDTFLERRELGLLNIGGPAVVTADGETFNVGRDEGLYLGAGTKEVSFASSDAATPAVLYATCVPAHKKFPNRVITLDQALIVEAGAQETSNKRKLYQYFHPDVLDTCQLLMGRTQLQPGNVWNTMPAHLHDRRMEAYLYFDMPEDAFVMHMMGRPQATRHMIVRNQQAVLSPPWSIHCGAGTGSYSFIWAMAGDNKSFKDMDMVPMQDLT